MAEPSKQQLLFASLVALGLFLAILFFAWSLNMRSPLSKVCPAHQPEPTELPLTEFGVSRARPDGLNLYCRACIRRKVTESRRGMREYRANRRRYFTSARPAPRQPLLVTCLTPDERVKEAIRKGASTQHQIAHETHLTKDAIGEALANLLLWTREIKTRLVGENRHYFINDSPEVPIRVENVLALPRQGDVRSSFRLLTSALGRKRRVG